MKGISEERLREMLLADESVIDIVPLKDFCQGRCASLYEALNECRELNDWKPIDDNTPTDRPILMYCQQADSHHKLAIDKYDDVAKFAYKPSHYQELPRPPKEQS